MTEKLYPEASPLSNALRKIAEGNRLSSLQVPVLEDAADHIEDLESRLRSLIETLNDMIPDMFPDQADRISAQIRNVEKNK